MNKAVTVILALILVPVSSAFGMVFSWTDSSGIKHFTNRRDDIPERYRTKARPLYPEQSDLAAGQQNTPSLAPPAAQQVQPAPAQAAAPPVAQQAKPVDAPKPSQPVVAVEPPKLAPAKPVSRRNRHRERSSGDE